MKFISLITGFALSSMLLGCGAGPKTLTYRAVTDSAHGTNFVKRLETEKSYYRHMVTNGNLYLLVKEYTPGLIDQRVSRTLTEPYIVSLRETYPELERYWPDSTAKDGGVDWLGEIPDEAREYFEDTVK